MRAITWNTYGNPDGLELRELEMPVPGDNEIRIRIHAATVSTGDCEMRTLSFRFPLSLIMRFYAGFFRPKRVRILGQEIAGVVDRVGASVTAFTVGDAILVQTDFTMGGHAEYRALSANPAAGQGFIARKPDNLTFEQAAAIPLGGLEALKFLREARVREGESILIVGSGGSIGTTAIQLARHYGAQVTAVDSGDKLEMMREIGAEHVIDFTKTDFITLSDTYDIIFDVVGKVSYRRMLPRLRNNGRLILANPRFGTLLRGSRNLKGGRRLVVGGENQRNDLEHLADLAASGVLTPVIDRTYQLEEAPEAHRYVDSGRKKGSVVLVMHAE